MRLLVIGDVHGNIIALEKVLQAFQNEVDAIVSHGDVVNYGPWSNECVALLKEVDCQNLMGNHEEAYLQGAYNGKSDLVKAFFAVTYKDFIYLDEIRNYREYFEIGEFLIRHTINDSYYYPDSDLTDVVLTKNTIIGHSHYAFHRTLSNGKTLTNTGSVGQNRKNLSKIECIILEVEKKQIIPKTLIYDPIPIINEMRVKKFPEICIQYYQSKLR
ncbi:metallophosphoesterase family protein [Candidatus Ulvibacter alkanivorans]|uniref:metallophosphoesterase family protein n=1 Tax=Candidatus Ulvibacter alkanivorans TaxID=2267620 RepID=UPI000DF29E8F|nr:metallophosphoesterase [Candidatus Ulvibacter alkanivorans]